MSKTKRALEALEEYPRLQEAALEAHSAIWNAACLLSALGPRGDNDEEFDAVQLDLLEAGAHLERRLAPFKGIKMCTLAGDGEETGGGM